MGVVAALVEILAIGLAFRAQRLEGSLAEAWDNTRMDRLIILAILAVVSFLVAWVVDGLVGILSGERPRDTGSLWFDTFLRFFAVLELGLIGRLLNYFGFDKLPRKIILFIGLLCALLFLLRTCHHRHSEQIYTIPVQSSL